MLALLQAYPSNGWNYSSDTIPLADINATAELPWNWSKISVRANISDITEYTNILWDWSVMTLKFTPQQIQDSNWPFDFSKATLNHFPLDYVIQHMDLNWNWQKLSESAKPDEVMLNPDLPWDSNYVYNLSCAFVEEHPQFKIKLYMPLNNSNTTNNEEPAIVDEIKAGQPIPVELSNPSEYYKYYAKYHPDFTLEFVRSNPDLPWNWATITKRLDTNAILANTDLPWDFSEY